MAELMQPNIVGNFLSAYSSGLERQQQQQDAAYQRQRQAKADQMAEQKFNFDMDAGQLDMALKRASALNEILSGVDERNPQTLEVAKQRYITTFGGKPEEVAGVTIADIPRIKLQTGQTLRELQIQATKANIAQSYAAAAASNRANRDAPGTLKPLPQKLQATETELLGDIQLAANNNSDVSMYLKKIRDGQLDPGLLKNKYDQAKSFFGVVDPADINAINYNNFLSDMKGLQNQSLRLNKGVQTEGDAQRAWDELFANLNDKNIVASRLQRIADINKRAAQQKAALIRNQRRNYFGKDYQEPSWGDFGFDASLVELPTTAKMGTGGATSGNVPKPPPGFVVR